jgi:hypothetical protein
MCDDKQTKSKMQSPKKNILHKSRKQKNKDMMKMVEPIGIDLQKTEVSLNDIPGVHFLDIIQRWESEEEVQPEAD